MGTGTRFSFSMPAAMQDASQAMNEKQNRRVSQKTLFSSSQQMPGGARRKIRSVSVVVATFNAERWLERCFGSLRNSEFPVSVVVVDCASDDNTLQRLRDGYPEVRVVSSNRNLGFGRANNLGFEAVGDADAVYLLNQDAWLFPDTIGRLVRTLDGHPDFGIVSPLHCKRDGVSMEAGFRSFLENNRLGEEDELVEVSFVNAAHWLVRRECLTDLGGFAPVFFHYGEDVNFSQRARMAGWRIGIDTGTKAVHDREGRPGSAERDLLELYASFLIYACMPDIPGWQALPGAWRRLVYNLFAMEVRPPRAFSRCFRHAVGDLPSIMRTRRELCVDPKGKGGTSVLA